MPKKLRDSGNAGRERRNEIPAARVHAPTVLPDRDILQQVPLGVLVFPNLRLELYAALRN